MAKSGKSAILGIVTSVSLLASAAFAADDFGTVLEKAKAEGSVIVRISNPNGQETHAALEKAFNERFGTDITIEWTPQNAPQTNARVIAEAGGGTGSVDIIGLGSAEDVETLRSRDLVKEYPWAEVFGNELPGIAAAIDDVIPDLRGAAFDLLDAVYGLGWNTNLIKPEEVPSTTTDFLDPKWNGKIALNAFFLNPLPTIAYVIGQDGMLDYAKKLIENKPILQRGSPVVMQALSVGQAPLGIITYHAAEAARKSGQPVDFKLFSDYIMVYQGYIYIPENAPNPNAARLFMAWLATEGTRVAEQFEAMPRLGDADSGIARLIARQQAETGAKIAAPTSLDEIAAQEVLREELTKLLTTAGN